MGGCDNLRNGSLTSDEKGVTMFTGAPLAVQIDHERTGLVSLYDTSRATFKTSITKEPKKANNP